MRLLRPNPARTSAFSLFLIPTCIMLIAESTISYYFPIVVERNLDSNLLLGIVMASSSIAGIFLDIITPKLFKKQSWKLFIFLGTSLSVGVTILAYSGQKFFPFILFILASIVWGIYYELLFFGYRAYIVKESKVYSYSRNWGIINAFGSLTVMIGPVLGAYLINSPELFLFTLLLLQLVSLVIFLSIFVNRKSHYSSKHQNEIVVDSKFKTVKVWIRLGWLLKTVILTSFSVSIMHATYWTIGGLFGEELAKDSAIPEFLIMTIYGLALLVGSFAISAIAPRWHKKKIAQASLVISGITMSLISLSNDKATIITLIFLSTSVLGVADSLRESIFSDLAARGEFTEMHILSLSGLSTSLSYIVGPILIGIISDFANYQNAFGIMGISVAIFATLLLLITPRKIRIPHLL